MTKDNNKIIYTASNFFKIINRDDLNVLSFINATDSKSTFVGVEVNMEETMAVFACTAGGIMIYDIQDLENP
jgi:hypothetical protein